jgi:uncharacterized protein (TIGR03083 family)
MLAGMGRVAVTVPSLAALGATMVFVTAAILFSRSAEAFIGILRQIRPEQWDLPGLGSWTVRSLAGHTARAILTVENYLNQEEPGDVTIPSAAEYYTIVYPQFTDDAAVALRGVEAGEWLGDDSVGHVTAALLRARGLIESQPANRIVSIGGMGILLTDYLHTRVFELVVHSIDLSRATGIPHALPPATIADAVSLAAATAVKRGDGEALLLAFTGRASLPEGFSIV